MRIEIMALQHELPTLADLDTKALCELLAGLGFPVDAVEEVNGTVVLEVDVTANRGDALSHRGLARDVAAKLHGKLTPITIAPMAEGAELFPVRLEDAACPLYATALLDLGASQNTPTEAQAFLASMGSNAKNLAPVDASNELLHRYGHPTHAFDADTLKGGIIVRRAKAREKLVTLDGVERTLITEDLVIADESGPIAMAGVMGGDSTKVTSATKRVLLESAYFDPRTVRAMARRHNLHTDASHRFGRGADPAFARTGRDLLIKRLQDWAGARLIGVWTAGTVPLPANAITFPQSVLDRVAGEVLPISEAESFLKNLGCAMTNTSEHLEVRPPTWRHDLAIPEDLAEEVLRLRGYDKISAALPTLEGHPKPLSHSYLHPRNVARRLANLGFHQAVTLGFIAPEADAAFASPDNPANGRMLANPLGVEYSVMRASLLSSLKTAARAEFAPGGQRSAPLRDRPGILLWTSSTQGNLNSGNRLGWNVGWRGFPH